MSKSVTICPFVWTQYRHWTDGQTDIIGKTISRSACISMLTCDKNCVVCISGTSSLHSVCSLQAVIALTGHKWYRTAHPVTVTLVTSVRSPRTNQIMLHVNHGDILFCYIWATTICCLTALDRSPANYSFCRISPPSSKRGAAWWQSITACLHQ